jgi:MFS family permease
MTRARTRLPEVLQDRHFRGFYLSQTVSALGGAMSPLAVTFAILAINGSAVDLGLVLGTGAVPALVLTLVGGVAGDRFERRRILVAADVTMAVCQAALAVAILTNLAEIWHFMLIEFIAGCGRAFTGPAATGFLPSLVRQDDLQSANALLRIARNLAQIIGPAAAGIVVAVASPGWALAVDALSFVVSAIILSRLPRSPGTVQVGMSLWGSLADGWREFRSRTWVWSMVASFAVYQATMLPALFVLGPVLIEQDYAGAGTWAAILSSRAIGALLMGFVLLRWRPNRPLVTSTAMILLDAPFFLALATGASMPMVVALAALSSAGVMAADTLWESTLQAKIRPDALSRVSSYDWVGSIVFNPLGFMLIGVVAASFGAGTVLVAVAVVHVLVRAVLLALKPIWSTRR